MVAPQLKARALLGVSRAAAPLGVIGQATDPQLVAEVQELRSENAMLNDRLQKLQMQCTSILGARCSRDAGPVQWAFA